MSLPATEGYMPKGHTAANRPRKRRPQERAEITRGKLLEAAEAAFSARGFDAVTVREIEELAGVQRNLVRYHFGNKKALWKAVVGRLIGLLPLPQEDVAEESDEHEEGGRRARLASLIRGYVRFSAANPAFHRLMLQEGKQDSWRIRFLADAYLEPAMLRLRRIVEAELRLSDEEFLHWYYLFVGAGPMPFSMAPEAFALFGVSTDCEAVIERHAEIMVDFLLSRPSQRAPASSTS